MCMYRYVYIYIYTYLYREREIYMYIYEIMCGAEVLSKEVDVPRKLREISPLRPSGRVGRNVGM